MKILFRGAVAVAALSFAGSAFAKPATATLRVENVGCVACAPIVKRALSRLPGVGKVTIVEEGNVALATVMFDDAKVKAAALAEATTNAGYPSTLKEVKSASLGR